LLYFFDESRFGTHSKLGHGWFAKGSRTAVKVKLGFQNFYLYSAVNPLNGEDLTLMLPKVNTEWMNIFLAQLSLQIGRKHAIVVIDGAGWHRSKDLKIPDNICLHYLPPYSPELNPVERLWAYIKQRTIKNKVYQTIAALEDTIAHFITTLEPSTVTSICKLDYL
jgi:transposase